MSIGKRPGRSCQGMTREQHVCGVQPPCVLAEMSTTTLGHQSYRYYTPRPTPASTGSLRLRWMSRSGYARAARAADAATLTSLRLRLCSNQVGRADPGPTNRSHKPAVPSPPTPPNHQLELKHAVCVATVLTEPDPSAGWQRGGQGGPCPPVGQVKRMRRGARHGHGEERLGLGCRDVAPRAGVAAPSARYVARWPACLCRLAEVKVLTMIAYAIKSMHIASRVATTGPPSAHSPHQGR